MNFKERLEAKSLNNQKELDEIAQLSTNARKSGSKPNKLCGSLLCVVSNYDNDEFLPWVQCDYCNKWCHTMCEGIPSNMMLSLLSDSKIS